MLDGIVEVDGAYYGGSPRPPNSGREGKVTSERAGDRRRKKCVLALVQRHGGAVAVVVPGETSEAALAMTKRHVRPGTVVAADELSAYDVLHARYDVLRINHSREYAKGPASTNHAESFHSRMRRAEIGQYHHVSGPYLHRYADEMAYRHSRRTTDNGSIYREIVEMALGHPVSREWKGYWGKRAMAY